MTTKSFHATKLAPVQKTNYGNYWTPVCMTLFFLSLLTGAANTRAATPSNTPVIIESVVAEVNKTVLLRSELQPRIAPYAAQIAASTQDKAERDRRLSAAIDQALQDMIDEELIVQAAKKAQLSIDTKEVDAAIDDIKKQNNLDDDALAQALVIQGYTTASYRKEISRQLLRLRAINYSVRPKVSIADTDVTARYNQMANQTNAASQIHLYHILLTTDGSTSQNEQLEKNARDIAARAESGQQFSLLAKEFSQDQSTKDSGGDLGWVEPGTLAAEWETILFSLPKGKITSPIQGPQGFHIFYIADKKRTALPPLKDLEEKIKNELYREGMEKHTKLWLEELRSKAHVDIKQL